MSKHVSSIYLFFSAGQEPKLDIKDGLYLDWPEGTQPSIPKAVTDNFWMTVSAKINSDKFATMKYEDFSGFVKTMVRQMRSGFYVTNKRNSGKNVHDLVEQLIRMLNPIFVQDGVDRKQIEGALAEEVQACRSTMQGLVLRAIADKSARFQTGSPMQVLYAMVCGANWKKCYKEETAATLTDAMREGKMTESDLLKSIEQGKFVGMEKAQSPFCPEGFQVGSRRPRDIDIFERDGRHRSER